MMISSLATPKEIVKKSGDLTANQNYKYVDLQKYNIKAKSCMITCLGSKYIIFELLFFN